jgi:transcriptional regulator with XRE-family HTH domain
MPERLPSFQANSLKLQQSNLKFSARSLKLDAVEPREFGVRLTQYRKRLQMSITQLATQAGVHYMQISRYEKGESEPSLDTAIRLAKVLQVSLDELATGSQPPEPLAFQNLTLFERMRELDQLPPARQELALRVLDTVISGHQLESLGSRLRRR